MEGSIVRQGSLYYQHQQRFGKKWKKVWAVLHRPASSGVARLEMHEGSQPPETGRKLECWKLIQLSECVSVSERGGENSPKDTRPFSIETAQRVYLLASETSEQPSWVKELCALAFPQDRLTLERRCSQPQQSEGLQLQENVLYSTSRESSAGNQFVVRIRQTDASSRCSLSGMYTLSVDCSSLSLRDRQNGSLLYSWPYPFLRRFGRDKTMFSFEAGRRCTSGEGTFEFETALGSQIFKTIETAISSRHNDIPTLSAHEQYSKINNPGSWPPAPTSALRKATSQPLPCPQVNLPEENHLPESDYAIPFDKVARNLLNTGFVGLLGPVPLAQGKIKQSRGAEHIYDEPEVPPNPVYDEPEEMKTDAWKTQGTNAHETGYEYPYLPGWDDYAVPRVGVATSTKGTHKIDRDEWGSEVHDDREYDNVTLKGSQKS